MSDPVIEDLHKHYTAQERAEKEYDARPEATLEDVVSAIGKADMHIAFWEAFSADGVVGSLGCTQEQVMSCVEQFDDDALGKIVRDQVVKYLITCAQPKLALEGNVKSDESDIIQALL